MSTFTLTEHCADKNGILTRGAEVVHIEAEALVRLAGALDDSFVDACNALIKARGRVVVSGMGKSGHVGRKIAATLSATGTPAFYVHPAEAAHGDLGMLVPGDVLLVISNSGNTAELTAILQYAKDVGITVIGISSKFDSRLMAKADVGLCLPPAREACQANIAPTTSTTMQLALGDALAMTVMDMRGFSRDGMKVLHPGGTIGLRLTAVREIMHSTERMPLVAPDDSMEEVVVTMTSMGFGIAGVVDSAGRLAGVITDGDLRRHFSQLGEAKARQVMTLAPKTLSSGMLAEDALQYLNESKITCAFVVDEGSSVNCNVPVGIVHVHDFLRLERG